MKLNNINLTTLLRIGLALTFLATSYTAFSHPEEFKELIKGSFLFSRLLDVIPFFPTLIGINDLVISLLLFSGFLPRLTSYWATLWLAGVVVVLLSQESFGSLGDAIEHASPIAIAIYLSLKASERA